MKSPISSVFVSLLFFFVSIQATATEPLTSTQSSTIDTLLAATYEQSQLPSLVVMIDRGGETLFAKAYGHADLAHGVPATVDTAYAIGSITKTFTGLAIAQLVTAGKVNLEATVEHYLPDYRGPGKVATVAQLLTHSSGIPSYNTEIPGVQEQLRRNAYSREQLRGLFEDLPLSFQPGERFSYTNSGYYLLGLIIEAVTGTDYYEYVEQAIFQPLDLERSFAGDLSEVVPAMARGYDVENGEFVHAPSWHPLVPFAAGSLVSTAADIVRYRRGVFRSADIPASVVNQLLTTTTLLDGTENTYSLGGLVLSDFHGHAKVSHAGDIWGYSSNHAYYPDEDVTIVLLANRQGSDPALSSIEAKVARTVLGIPQPQIRQLTLTDDELARYTGDFVVHPFLIGFEALGFIASPEGQLLMRFGGVEAPGPAIPLLAQGNGVFRAPFDDEWVFTFDAEQPQATTLVSTYRDGTITAQRDD